MVTKLLVHVPPHKKPKTLLIFTLPTFYLYIIVISPDDVRNFRPKCVAYVRNKWMSEHLWCLVGLMAMEDVNLLLLLYTSFSDWSF
jgi:hypothetical protein